MKNEYIYLFLILSLVYACGGGSDSEMDPAPTTNQPPSTPAQVYPGNNIICVDNSVTFQWNMARDPENQSITYKVEVSENSSFSSIAYERTTTSLSTVIALDKGKVFYWRIKAVDSKNAESSFSSSNQFLTEGEGVSNHLPFAPELVLPSLNAITQGTTVTLSWSASDVDNDNLTFDVYLDTVNPLATKVSENQTATTFDAISLGANTTYYWIVAVKDEHGAQTIGQIWSFKTN